MRYKPCREEALFTSRLLSDALCKRGRRGGFGRSDSMEISGWKVEGGTPLSTAKISAVDKQLGNIARGTKKASVVIPVTTTNGRLSYPSDFRVICNQSGNCIWHVAR